MPHISKTKKIKGKQKRISVGIHFCKIPIHQIIDIIISNYVIKVMYDKKVLKLSAIPIEIRQYNSNKSNEH